MAPYQTTDADGETAGRNVELVRAIAKQANCSVTFLDAPFKRILRDMREGDGG
jgi:hypothetical protein